MTVAALIPTIRFIVFDFDGVFTDNMVYVDEHGSEMVRCSRSDGLGLRKLDALGIASMVLSTETHPVVSARCGKLKIACEQGVADKAVRLREIVAERGFTLQQTAFVGNDINDAGALALVGLPMIVQDAHPDVYPLASYRTYTPGGLGAVREICDLFAQYAFLEA